MLLRVLACSLLLTTHATLRISDYNSSFVGDPDVILIGVQKGGTTSLTGLLAKLLKLFVFSGPNSESHFFSSSFNDNTFNSYIEGFDEHRKEVGDRKSFDGSTTYFPSAEVFRRMKRLYSPECLRKKKFILSLREPISRDFSWFSHYFGECKKGDYGFCPSHGGPDFHDTFHDYVKRGSSYGYYLKHLKDILAIIPRDQLFIYNFEIMVGEQGDDAINRLLYFVGEQPVYSKENLFPHVNVREYHYKGLVEEDHYHEILCSDIRYLNQTYQNLNKGLEDFINLHPDKPVSEPHFLPFSERFSEKCIEDDGSEVYLY